ncbi:MAG: hypothetical protein OEW12_06000 [Deltaproteobacteria bacterium]|nr:hypothetical protein [Deltaproteobacteria bacterium]
MSENKNTAASFFRSVQAGEEAFDPEKFILEVQSNFQSEEISNEVHWRIQVLREITSQPQYKGAGDGLRNQLSKIFATTTDENQILNQLKTLTQVEGSDGKPIDLRSFVKREKRVLGEMEYRQVLGKKIKNTQAQVENLSIFFPDQEKSMRELSTRLEGLSRQIKSPLKTINEVKQEEDTLRNGDLFKTYEELKEKFLKDWLMRFGNLSQQDVEKLDPKQVQSLILEHQRHQMTQLLKTQIKLSDLDMTEHLIPHDTLECGYKEKAFWKSCSMAGKEGFKNWIMGVIQAFGMVKGRRYALFQNDKDEDQYLLFGVGVSDFSKNPDKMVEMMPYIKPFTRKSGYLLEIRQREIGNPDEYFTQLRHYVLPFLFAFDHMEGLKINTDLMTFFTSKY